MKTNSILGAAIAATVLLTLPAQGRSVLFGDDFEMEPEPLEPSSFYERFVANRLAMGISVAQTDMKKTHVPYDPAQRSNFLGNLNSLDETSTVGWGIVVRYDFCPYVAIECANDLHVEMDTLNRDGDSCDGALEMNGYRAQLLLRYPFEDIPVAPYVGLGLLFAETKYNYRNWWHYGWSSPADYETYGNGSRSPRNGASRWMDLDDPSPAPLLTVGLTVCLHRHCDLDLFYRYADVDPVSVDFYRKESGRRYPMRTGEFPLEHGSFGASLSFVF